MTTRIFIAVIAFLVLFIYVNKHMNPTNSPQPLNRLFNPFDRTVYYRIGAVDPRFNLSQSQLIALAKEATDIWHQGSHKTLFVYDPQASLAINLIYDNRQAETNLRDSTKHQLESQLIAQKSHVSQFEQAQDQLKREHMQIEIRRANFRQQQGSYNRSVDSWNTLGNADAYTRQQLAQQRRNLDEEEQQINQDIDRYNLHVQQINQNAQQLNQQAASFNQNVDQYRTRFTPREFEKGVYNGHEINIYEFGSTDELRIAIAHELGHALGLGHNTDPYALMYPTMQKQNMQNFRLTAADLAMVLKQ